MPIDYRIDKERRVSVIFVSSPVTEADISEYFQRIVADPEIDRGSDALVDLRNMEIPTLPTEEIRQFARRLKKTNLTGGRTRTAIIAESDVMFGLSRLFEMEREDGTLHTVVFPTESEAMAWLASRP